MPMRRGWNEPTPAAMTTAPASKVDAAGRAHAEAAILAAGELHHLLPQVKLRLERLDLLQQPIDQFLRAAHRQRRNVVNRLVRIELRALAAGVRQRVHHVGADAEQAELEDLEQPAGAGPDDDDFGGYGGRGGPGRRLAQGGGFRKIGCGKPL